MHGLSSEAVQDLPVISDSCQISFQMWEASVRTVTSNHSCYNIHERIRSRTRASALPEVAGASANSLSGIL